MKADSKCYAHNRHRAVFHYNFGWPDLGVSPMSTLLDMCKVVDFALTQGRAAVHCHAGLGRTGVLMAVHLIWSRQLHPHEAIDFVRKRRPNSVQNREQVELVYAFADYLWPIRLVFNIKVSFAEYLDNQQHALHGVEARVLKNVPKLCYVICERLGELCGLTPMGTLAQKLHMLTSGDDMFYENILTAQRTDASGTMQMIRHLSMDMKVDGESFK